MPKEGSDKDLRRVLYGISKVEGKGKKSDGSDSSDSVDGEEGGEGWMIVMVGG
jgi:hypothetical protein